METDDLFDFLETPHKRQLPQDPLHEEGNENTLPHDMEEEDDGVEDIFTTRARERIQRKYADVLPTPDVQEDVLEAQYVGCKHQVATPQGITPSDRSLNPPYPEDPAKTYPFTLDDFQRLSVGCIGQQESVLVSAHTSAGKTVVAEYAIAMSLRNHQRVIYTSPIKALSNQKYRDLQQEFGDVGLITGDTTINEEASCLVMTTEILRNMLYRGHDVMREVAWVIFDEIHYMRDKERGVVWEESIILLPDTVRYVFLSATIPNAFEFAQWIATIHSQVCHVVYTDYRPVPLQHYVFPSGGTGIHLVVDQKGKFRDDNFNKALSILGLESVGARRGGFSAINKSNVVKIIRTVMKNDLAPVIIFAFSRKDLEQLARNVKQMNFTSDQEKTLIGKTFSNAIQCLAEQDRQLPEITEILPLLLNGIGIHHSGLLPLVKEIVELLFQEGLLKCLFATETFSMGLNMPARTVVFASIRKFDGKQYRYLRPGEYIQMSGRAGRRGKDSSGTTILMVDEKIEPKILRNLVFGKPDALTSAFYLGYNMLLNLMKLEASDPELLISKSFRQFQTNNKLPKLQQTLDELHEREKQFIIPREDDVKPLYHLQAALEKHRAIVHDKITSEQTLVPFLANGRLVHILDPESLFDFGWAPVIVGHRRKAGTVDVIVAVKKGALQPTPADIKDGGVARVVTFKLEAVRAVSTMRLTLPENVRERLDAFLAKCLDVISRKYPTWDLPELDPIADMRVTERDVVESVGKIRELEKRWEEVTWDAELERDFALYKQREELREEISVLGGIVVQSKDVILKDELRSMRRVLKRLGYVSEDDIVQVKGRVAAELSAGNEIVLTELLFSGFFTALDTQQTASILAAFVMDEKSVANEDVPKELKAEYAEVLKTARRVATVLNECRLPTDVDDFLKAFKATLVPVVWLWCDGVSFSELTKSTDLFEGSIIRGMRRLEELLKQMGEASKYMGNPDLAKKFSEAIRLVKRGIIFAVSLYID